MRSYHEQQLHDENCFVTLTYDDDHLPYPPEVDNREHQLFMKRLRKRFGADIRFFMCGEYGEQLGRPHYHYILFNFDFPDKELAFETKRGDKLYSSESLKKLWPYGFSSIGDVTFESSAYVARYITKKINGDMKEEHYRFFDKDTGELVLDPRTGNPYLLRQEFTRSSKRPAIGKEWLEKYLGDVYPHDYVIIRGKKVKPPRYYDRQYEVAYPSDFEELKCRRVANAEKHVDNNTPERLNVREKLQLLKMDKLLRPIEKDT
jgi:hypothetical protein